MVGEGSPSLLCSPGDQLPLKSAKGTRAISTAQQPSTSVFPNSLHTAQTRQIPLRPESQTRSPPPFSGAGSWCLHKVILFTNILSP